MNPTRGGWLILLTVVIAMLLGLLHLPETWPQWLGWLRPAWLAMVVFFWVMELPHRIGLISVWLLGLLVDALLADPLGLNGFLLAAITYIGWRFYERLRMYSVFQQAGVLLLLVLTTEGIRMAVQDVAFDRGFDWQVVLPGVSSMLVWPFLYVLLQRLRTQVRVE